MHVEKTRRFFYLSRGRYDAMRSASPISHYHTVKEKKARELDVQTDGKGERERDRGKGKGKESEIERD